MTIDILNEIKNQNLTLNETLNLGKLILETKFKYVYIKSYTDNQLITFLNENMIDVTENNKLLMGKVKSSEYCYEYIYEDIEDSISEVDWEKIEK